MSVTQPLNALREGEELFESPANGIQPGTFLAKRPIVRAIPVVILLNFFARFAGRVVVVNVRLFQLLPFR